MKNPFLYTRYESPIYFCNRERETKEIIKAIEAGRSVTLYSIRRLGKTGLIKHIFYKLKRKRNKIIPVYVDIYPTKSSAEFVGLLISKTLYALEKNNKRFLESLSSFFGRYRPKISFDSLTGNPSIYLDIKSQEEIKISLDTLFDIIRKKKVKIVLAVDEFQQIGSYDDSSLQALLRSYIQEIKELSFIFSGSKRNLLMEIFASPKKPLFHTTQFYPLNKINHSDYKQFIQFHFDQGLRNISGDHVDNILRWTKSHTYFVQFYCHRLYESVVNQVTDDDLEKLNRQLFIEFEVIFYNYMNLLTTNQWNLLKAIGKEEILAEPTSKKFISKYNLGAHSTVRQSLANLEENELVYSEVNPDTKKKEYQVYDVFLSRWLSATQ